MSDTYLTLSAPAEASLRERGSKFLGLAFPVRDEEQIRRQIEALRKTYYDATHVCYAWRRGAGGEKSYSSDDREPSGTAGKPILGVLLSHGLTDCLLVVARWFGGTKLGVPGLITAYREAATAAIAAGEIVERTVERRIRIEFDYAALNEVMRMVKEQQPRILAQQLDNRCTMELAVRESRAEELTERLRKAGAIIRV